MPYHAGWTQQNGFVHAGIITASRPDIDNPALSARLKQQGFICSLRENRLRIAPHFYNTEEEVERFCAALPGRGERVV